jgi:hypothetical protein
MNNLSHPTILARRGVLPAKRPAFRISVIASLAPTAIALMLSACAGSKGGPALKGRTVDGQKCFVPSEEAPDPSVLESIKLPKSRIWVTGKVPTSAISAKIAEEIPATLAQEKDRDVGAPGRATYRVTRGTPTLHQNGSDLQVRVPISADISVCKPLGPTCLKYGSCQPRLAAEFNVSTELGKDYELASPVGSIAATKRCVIGIDVTRQIEAQAKKEVAKVQHQIAAQWPQLKPDARKAWKELAHPIAISDDTCVNLAPSKLAYQPPKIEKTEKGEYLTTAVGVIGEITPAQDCSSKRKPGALLSPKISKAPGHESRLWFPEVLDLQTTRDGLAASISGPLGEEGTLEVLEVRLSQEQVALHVRTEGEICGQFWITGELSHKAGADALGLSHVKLHASAPTEDETAALVGVFQVIEERARVGLASQEWFSDQRLGPLKAALRVAMPDDVKLKIAGLKAGAARILAADEGLYVLHPLSAKLSINEL